MMPREMARVTASVRSLTSIFSNMWRKCVLTELTLIPSISATSGLENPLAAS